jgi:putative peptide zinc metalloprotease protein
MSEKTKPELELLIRSRGSSPGSSGSFVTKRYVANQVALTVRPRRIPEDSYEVQAQSRKDRKLFYVIRQLDADKYLFLNEEEYFLWQKMDGLHTLRDVATAYFIKFGSFDFRVIHRFLARARDQKLIVIPQTDLLRPTLSDESASLKMRALSRLRAIDLRLSNVDQRLGVLYRRLRFLFGRPAFVAYGLLLALGVLSLFGQSGRHAGTDVLWTHQALLLPLFILLHGLAIVVHELAHALACKHFGREVKAFGFTFMNRLLPSVYADVTDMWMSTRRARMAVSFAGPLSGLLIGSASAGVAWLLPPGTASSFFWLFSLSLLALSLGSLYPCLFIESDGYHILSDWLRMPALREHSRKFLQGRLRAVVQRRKTSPMTSDERAFLLYGLASIASLTAIGASFVVLAACPMLP